MDKIIERWNNAVCLTRPSLEELRIALGLKVLTLAFSDTPVLIFAGNNILISMPVTQPVHRNTRVESVSLILISDFFSPDAQVKTVDVDNLKMFGLMLAGTAPRFLQAAQAAGFDRFELGTETGRDTTRWTIRYASALVFEFESLEPGGRDPDKSRLVQVNFNYCVPFTSTRKPFVHT